jgi:hypothetical protein
MEKPQLFMPVFVQQPDGSLAQGLPPGYREGTPPGTPRQHPLDPTVALSADVVRVLARHEALFLALLLLQLIVECIFETVHIKYREDAIFELSLIYPSISISVLRGLYWMAIAGEVTYFIAFFCLGVLAAVRSKSRLYQRISTVALIGTLGQLPLAYLNRFNLLVFFLRFITYAYARFHWNLLDSIGLIREDLLVL